MRIFAISACAASLVAISACNMVAFTTNQTAPVLRVAAPALNQESDYEFARMAAPASLKTVEGFWLASPDNSTLMRILAQGYCEYAFGFLEMDVLKAHEAGHADEEAELTQRATNLYLRCTSYSLKLLGGSWEKALYGDLATFEAKVKKAGSDDVFGMFFVALGLASAINLNRDDIDLVAYMPKARALFERVAALDGRFYDGGAYMALGMLDCAQGKAVGGDPDKGKKEFEQAIAVSGGKYLMPKVLMAAAYGTVTNDREFFHRTLVQVLETSPAVYPDQRLANEIAHLRAKQLLRQEKELF